MTGIVTQCRRCGVQFEPSAAAIRAGTWSICPNCAPKQETGGHCKECGRALRHTTRTICFNCLMGGGTV